MDKVTLDDIRGPSVYERSRQGFRREIIELKKKRRVAVGDRVSLVFENRETVIFQIQEMLRAERIEDLDRIREEIEVYNGLIPGPGELRATLFLEIADQNHLREELLKFLGIDEAVFLKIGDRHRVHARFEEGHSKEDKIAAVQYVTFSLTDEQIEALRTQDASVLIQHPNYSCEARLNDQTKAQLLADLTV